MRFARTKMTPFPSPRPVWVSDVSTCLLRKVLSDEGKRKQYDTYGSAGFDAGQAGGGQQYWSGQAGGIDPEELFRKIFGEFSGGRAYGDLNAIFDQPQEVRASEWREGRRRGRRSLPPPLGSSSPLTLVLLWAAVHHGADLHAGGQGRQQGDLRQRGRGLPDLRR